MLQIPHATYSLEPSLVCVDSLLCVPRFGFHVGPFTHMLSFQIMHIILWNTVRLARSCNEGDILRLLRWSVTRIFADMMIHCRYCHAETSRYLLRWPSKCESLTVRNKDPDEQGVRDVSKASAKAKLPGPVRSICVTDGKNSKRQPQTNILSGDVEG